ncbi:hypothetical protein [Methylobacterium marchantiae]|uniref:Uncharacterized protein n=1 Tax=Methylobacterium marchantiae TaxID=600331 RepID=A0ABW3X006_9HYPH|nr:hypothetical protein AIGOOFII_1715 [Methylobacterium marchantiae]
MKCASVILLGVFAASPAAEALAQNARDVPITQDLRREERIERRLDRDMPPPVDPNVSPDNPDGVVGFDGPPGMFENGVENGSPVPSGSPADADDD